MKTIHAISYAKLQRKFGGEYIARKKDKIVAHARTYPDLVQSLLRKKIDRASTTIGFVPPLRTVCIYAN